MTYSLTRICIASSLCTVAMIIMLESSAVQCSAVQCSTVQYSTDQYITVQ